MPNYCVYSEDEQREHLAAGHRCMVNDESYREDEDGVCRQPMVWLKPTGLRAAPIQEVWLPKGAVVDPAVSQALAAAGFRFPLQPGDFVHSCCEGTWFETGDVAVEELFCCSKQDTGVFTIIESSHTNQPSGGEQA